MNVANEPYRSTESTTNDRFHRAFDTARERATQAVDFGEDCVRRHPETAVWSSFATGMLFGLLAGWLLAQQLEDPWRRDLRSMLSRLQSRLHF